MHTAEGDAEEVVEMTGGVESAGHAEGTGEARKNSAGNLGPLPTELCRGLW